MILYSFSLCPGFIPLDFTDKVFNEALLTILKVMVIQGRVL